MYPSSYHGYTPSSAQQPIDIKLSQRVPTTHRANSLKIKRRDMQSAPTSSTSADLSTQSLQRPRNVNTMYMNHFPKHQQQRVPRATTATSPLKARNTHQVKVNHNSYTSMYNTSHNSSLQKTHPMWSTSRLSKDEIHPDRKKRNDSHNRVSFTSNSSMSSSHRDHAHPARSVDARFNVDSKISTMDLQAGTVKASGHVQAYTGHVPAHPRNKARAFDRPGKSDPKRAGLRDQLRSTVNINMPGYAGFQPKSTRNFLGRVLSHEGKTTNEQDFSKKPVNGNNTREFGNSSTIVQQFFTHAANTSSDGLADAQKFYRIRPFEGQVKLGAKNERGWISDNLLKRSYIE